MIAFRYTKTDGAEYLSHLDLLRHIERTLRRAGIKVNLSEGFHPHPKIFLNNPLGLGIKSIAEYGAIDCEADDFQSLFNANSPAGVKCLGCRTTEASPNYANTIETCLYSAEGINEFSVEEFLGRKELVIVDKRGRTADVRGRIHGLENRGGKLFFTLGCGTDNLRPDLFCEILEGEFGGKARGLIKLEAHGEHTF